jgi:hypothetical protein
VLLDNAIDGRAEAGSFADLFGGEERLKDAIESLAIHAATGIVDCEKEERAGPGLRMLARKVLIDLDAGGAQRELAAFGHGIARITVSYNLFQHPVSASICEGSGHS